jgi:iduronate 2-sulfatase
VLTAAAAALATPAAGSAASSKRNVLYIVFDDLRPDLSPYGQSQMSTPHIQHLADTGVVFDRAFVQISVCSPSRMSFSTGRRPNGTQAWK